MHGDDADGRADLWGWEWDFLAVDNVGQVAVLPSAGYAPIPASVLAARATVERAIATIDALPARTRAIRADPHRDGDYSDWYALSARGFYAYDWRHYDGPYELIASPAEPVDIRKLPADVRSAAGILRIPRPFAGLTRLHLP